MSDDEIQQLKKTEVKQETIQERMKRQKQERREELVYTQEDEDRWARNRERVISEQNTIEVPSFDLDKALKNPELDGIKPLNIDPVSMAVKTVVDLIEGGKEFIANPSLGGVAAMAVTAIPGKYADKVLESNYSPVALRDSKRLSSQYGGDSSDWAKFSSSQHISSDGRKFETHWYENILTGQKVEPKTIVEDYLKNRM